MWHLIMTAAVIRPCTKLPLFSQSIFIIIYNIRDCSRGRGCRSRRMTGGWNVCLTWAMVVVTHGMMMIKYFLYSLQSVKIVLKCFKKWHVNISNNCVSEKHYE